MVGISLYLGCLIRWLLLVLFRFDYFIWCVCFVAYGNLICLYDLFPGLVYGGFWCLFMRFDLFIVILSDLGCLVLLDIWVACLNLCVYLLLFVSVVVIVLSGFFCFCGEFYLLVLCIFIAICVYICVFCYWFAVWVVVCNVVVCVG